MSDTKYNTSPTLINSLLNFPKFAQNIYQCLYPSEPAITPDDIKPISLAGVYNEDPHNDFGFFVRDKRIMLFVETQHEPTQNALLRSMLYLAAAYSNFCIENHLPVYKEAPVSLPRPEVFLICTENNSDMPDTLQLFDSKDNSKPVSIKAKVLKHTGTGNVVDQYISFCQIRNQQEASCSEIEEAWSNTIQICSKEDILTQFLHS